MLDPIFSRHGEVPQTPTNAEREQAWRNSFKPHRQDEAAASRGALADGDFLYGGGEMQPKRNGESDTERVRAQVAGKSAAASTQSPQRAIPSPQPAPAGPPQAGTYTHTPGD